MGRQKVANPQPKFGGMKRPANIGVQVPGGPPPKAAAKPRGFPAGPGAAKVGSVIPEVGAPGPLGVPPGKMRQVEVGTERPDGRDRTVPGPVGGRTPMPPVPGMRPAPPVRSDKKAGMGTGPRPQGAGGGGKGVPKGPAMPKKGTGRR